MHHRVSTVHATDRVCWTALLNSFCATSHCTRCAVVGWHLRRLLPPHRRSSHTLVRSPARVVPRSVGRRDTVGPRKSNLASVHSCSTAACFAAHALLVVAQRTGNLTWKPRSRQLFLLHAELVERNQSEREQNKLLYSVSKPKKEFCHVFVCRW